MKRSYMKYSLLSALFFILSVTIKAQSDSTKKQIFHGVVKNEKNKAIQNASVIVEGEEKGTTTDSEGFFKITARPNAMLVISADGYEPFHIPVRRAESVRLVMLKNNGSDNDPDNVANEFTKQQTASNDFRNYVNTESSRNYTGSYLSVIKANEGTVGSRFLFDKWLDSKLTDKKNNQISVKEYSFNYDKMGGKILATNDQKTIIEIDESTLSGFSFTDPMGQEIIFKKVDAIEKNKFLIVLAEKVNNGYSLYKNLKTEFVKADYSNNGLIRSGHNYDEYVDKPEYFIIGPDSVSYKIDLKEKSFKKVLESKKEIVKSFLDSHRDDKFDESLVIQLISYINSH